MVVFVNDVKIKVESMAGSAFALVRDLPPWAFSAEVGLLFNEGYVACQIVHGDGIRNAVVDLRWVRAAVGVIGQGGILVRSFDQFDENLTYPWNHTRPKPMGVDLFSELQNVVVREISHRSAC